MIISTVSSKGQITIPKKIREFLSVDTFDKVVFIPLEEGKVIMTSKQNSATELFGMLSHRKLSRSASVADMKRAVQKRRAKRGTK
jgi:AbrB family looped-hinge helix DNA binding protein